MFINYFLLQEGHGFCGPEFYLPLEELKESSTSVWITWLE